MAGDRSVARRHTSSFIACALPVSLLCTPAPMSTTALCSRAIRLACAAVVTRGSARRCCAARASESDRNVSGVLMVTSRYGRPPVVLPTSSTDTLAGGARAREILPCGPTTAGAGRAHRVAEKGLGRRPPRAAGAMPTAAGRAARHEPTRVENAAAAYINASGSIWYSAGSSGATTEAGHWPLVALPQIDVVRLVGEPLSGGEHLSGSSRAHDDAHARPMRIRRIDLQHDADLLGVESHEIAGRVDADQLNESAYQVLVELLAVVALEDSLDAVGRERLLVFALRAHGVVDIRDGAQHRRDVQRGGAGPVG